MKGKKIKTKQNKTKYQSAFRNATRQAAFQYAAGEGGISLLKFWKHEIEWIFLVCLDTSINSALFNMWNIKNT